MFVMDFVQIFLFLELLSCCGANAHKGTQVGCCALRSATVFCCTDCIFFAMFYIFKN